MKSRFYRIVFLIYWLIPLVSIIMMIKPGASIFYDKHAINHEFVEPDKSNTYQYTLNSSFLFSSPSLSLLYEDDLLLTRANSTQSVMENPGGFVFSEPTEGNLTLFFSPTDKSDPRTNGKEYIVYNHIVLFSRPTGVFYLVLWTLGSVWVGGVKLKLPEKRQKIKEALAQSIEVSSVGSNHWKNLFTSTIVAIYIYVFMEWLFFVTQPSFMDILSWLEKIEIFFLAGFALSIVGGGLLLVCIGFDYILSRLKAPRIFVLLGLIVPTSIITALAFLMIDNFTYTMFKFGVVSTKGAWRGVYGVILLILFTEIYARLSDALGIRSKAKNQQQSNASFFIACGLLVVSSILIFSQPKFVKDSSSPEEKGNAQQATEYPNIILLGSDGLNAQHMSVYGYERETTPIIKEFAQTALIVENAFPNAAHSSGSVISILTSKLPTENRLLYPPDILKGTDAYQHLPGILKRMGYQNIEIAVPHYVDSFTMNMQNGFDIVNQQAAADDNPVQFLNELGYFDIAYFLSTLFGRVEDRALHVFYVKKMVNPFEIVTQPTGDLRMQDRARMDQLLDVIINSDSPVFVHVHLMGTHGAKFYPNQRVFSERKEQPDPWMTDFYDDAILTFDTYVGEVIDALDEAGTLNNTILIIYTDHAQRYKVNVRIPLIIHFPGGEYQGSIATNAQNLDIAPTILDYLEITQPEWMGGQSLLRDDFQGQRLIFSMSASNNLKAISDGKFALDVEQLTPPFYQFGKVNIVDCQMWYSINFASMEWSSGEVAGHTAPCGNDELFSMEQIEQALIDHLSREGFDTSSFP